MIPKLFIQKIFWFYLSAQPHWSTAAWQRLLWQCRFKWRWITKMPQLWHFTFAPAVAGQLSLLWVWSRIHNLNSFLHPKHFSSEPPQHSCFSIPLPLKGTSGRGGSGSSQSSSLQLWLAIAISFIAVRNVAKSSRGQNSPHTGGTCCFSDASSTKVPGDNAISCRSSHPNLWQHSLGWTCFQKPSLIRFQGELLVKPILMNFVPITSKMYRTMFSK